MALRITKIQTGLVEGVPCGNPAFTVFKGIPYARPPVGEYRWRAPEDPEPWEGIRRCDTFPPISIQRKPVPGEFYQKEFFPVDMPMSEDCLYLNVWTPSVSGDEKYPVMMWIHGGAYMQGYGHEMEFDGEAFCRRGVILVTINYRLGVLGFFSHPELSARSPNKVSGNYGILDQIHALKWIRNNISAFGGDPYNVTIFGQSAGGGSVQAIVSSPLAKGLFRRAIVQSAGGINTLGGDFSLDDAEKIGLEVSAKTGKGIDELMQMDARQLTQMVNKIIMKPVSAVSQLKMKPNCDGYVLLDNPGKSIAYGRHEDVDYMTGSVPGDGFLFEGWPVKTKEEFEESLKIMHGKYYEKYRELFGVKSDADVQKIQEARIKAASMIAPRGWAKAHIKIGRKPLFVYYFNRDIPGEDRPGAFHSCELWYVFGTVGRCWRPMDAVDYGISIKMTDYWTNFAKRGDPNGEGLPYWPAFTQDNPLTLEINEKGIKAADMSNLPYLKEMEELLLEEVYEGNESK